MVQVQPTLRLRVTTIVSSRSDTRALQARLGHHNIQHTVRYTELATDRFKDFLRSQGGRSRSRRRPSDA